MRMLRFTDDDGRYVAVSHFHIVTITGDVTTTTVGREATMIIGIIRIGTTGDTYLLSYNTIQERNQALEKMLAELETEELKT